MVIIPSFWRISGSRYQLLIFPALRCWPQVIRGGVHGRLLLLLNINHIFNVIRRGKPIPFADDIETVCSLKTSPSNSTLALIN